MSHGLHHNEALFHAVCKLSASHLHAIVAFHSPSLCVGFVRSFGTRRDLHRSFSMQHYDRARCAFLLVTSVRMAFYYDDEHSLGRVSPK